MKSLILNTFDTAGGAAKAGLRLHNGLKQLGVDSQMLVQYKNSDDQTVCCPVNSLGKWVSKIRPSLDDLPLRLYRQRTFQRGNFSLQWVPDAINRQTALIKPDVVNLHWTSGYLQIENLAKFSRPLVWTLHDMWAFTGGCHYSGECDRYLQQCGACPQLGSSKDWDLSRWVWQRKLRAWQKLNLSIVTPSKWLAQCAKTSPLFKNLQVEVIPNSLNVQVFKPLDRSTARNRLNLPQDKRLILFGAMSPGDNPRKGFHLLQATLQKFGGYEQRDNVDLVMFGASQLQLELPYKLHCLGKLSDDSALSLAYAAADVFVAPSTQDNLPNTVMESLACGTPSVTFKIGGMPDMIKHCQNGYLATPFDTNDLAEGIRWVLVENARHRFLCQNARERAVSQFSLEIQARRYLTLFEQITANTSSTSFNV